MAMRTQKGFSLFEVLIVLFLIASVMGLVVANFDTILKGLEEKDLRQQFFSVLREARYQAGLSKNTCTLRYENNAFIISSHTGDVVATRPTQIKESNVSFYKILPNEDPQAPLVLEPFKESVDRLTISALGCSTPVSVVLKTGASEEHFLLDPFSSAPLPTIEDRELKEVAR
jgi:prepilin-type N-terminal cleavage/methylation domain-containing protein